ncbi:hypothetical protein [Parafrankia soli]|uniref:hypothetical protein n=1 Tax=Parafrankia soli TaxID=2599596 RepID=UPI003B586553
MGHDSPRAALIYQHTSTDADTAIADAVNARLTGRQDPPKQADPPDGKTPRDDPDDGAAGALIPA